MTELIDRLYDRLLAALSTSPDPTLALTIGDLYQRLIPYRSIRGELGVLELAQYEHALLRLLAGEGGRLRVEDSSAALEFQRELDSPNPILGIYRDYAESPVVIDATAPAPVGRVPTAEPERFGNADAANPRAATGAEPISLREPAPVVTTCQSCEHPLPPLTDLRFCPFCGTPQPPPPCAACGAAIQPGWNFCVHCGAARG